jgi:hypothetical protein
MSTLPHPELATVLATPARDGTGLAVVEVEPCSPSCPMPMARLLWPAWRDLTTMREQVDAELSGEMTVLLPELWRMWRGLESGAGGGEARGEAVGDGPAIDDSLQDQDLRLVLEDLYRAVFALGAGWARNRLEIT